MGQNVELSQGKPLLQCKTGDFRKCSEKSKHDDVTLEGATLDCMQERPDAADGRVLMKKPETGTVLFPTGKNNCVPCGYSLNFK